MRESDRACVRSLGNPRCHPVGAVILLRTNNAYPLSAKSVGSGSLLLARVAGLNVVRGLGPHLSKTRRWTGPAIPGGRWRLRAPTGRHQEKPTTACRLGVTPRSSLSRVGSGGVARLCRGSRVGSWVRLNSPSVLVATHVSARKLPLCKGEHGTGLQVLLLHHVVLSSREDAEVITEHPEPLPPVSAFTINNGTSALA